MLPPPPISTLFPYTTLFRSHIFLREPFGHRIYNLRAQDESDTDHRTDDSEGSRPRVKLVTHIDRDQWAKAAKHKQDRKSTRLNSSHVSISYAVFCLKKKTLS